MSPVVEVKLGDDVYLTNYLPDTSIFKDVYVDQCSATDPDNWKSVTLISDGCPTAAAQPLFSGGAESFDTPGLGRGVRHRMEVFRMSPSTERMEFACVVELCKSLQGCPKPDCTSTSTRRKRQADHDQVVTKTTIIIIDPDTSIIRKPNYDEPTASTSDDPELVIILLSCACALVVLICAVMGIYICHSRRAKSPQPRLADVSTDVMAWFHMPRARHDQPHQMLDVKS